MTRWNLDADAFDADWPKKVWDLGGPHKIKYVLENVIGSGCPVKDHKTLQGRLTSFMKTPSGHAMPPEHRAKLRKMGYTVPD